MRGIGAHQLLLARFGQRLDIARHIFGRYAHGAQAAHLQVGEVLAHAFFVLQHLRQWRGDGAELRVVVKLPENTGGQFAHTGLQ